MVSRYSAYRRGPDTIAPEVVDRILLGACAAVWLTLIGVSVAAAVALTDLGRGFHKAASSAHTTWVLYAVIAISALIIAGAIPVLLRARRAPDEEPVVRPAGGTPTRTGSPQPIRSGVLTRTLTERGRTERIQALRPAASNWSGAAVDRIWMRGTVALTGTIGIALIAVAAATYLMAVNEDGASWLCYTVAGLVTAGVPAIEWYHVRQLRGVAAAQ
ncbi:MAG: DUF2561 family protein [Mycobacterium sp.]|uniref:DUF2561 family protein n=1 Tax=Mycobacterium sp. TaxID=1785 RepID=UPI001ED04F9B|nr:DUF2561 family protein [Mycobacterium sp.]MBW0018189.1 DUF2561 family protein [Mycobacterium sp.]